MKGHFLRHFLISLALMCAISSPVALASSTETSRHILVLLAYRIDLYWTQALISGLRDAQQESDVPVEFYFEYLDTKRLESRFTPAQLHSYLIDKYRDTPLSAVFMEPDTAEQMLIHNTSHLLEDKLVVVVGTDHQRIAPVEPFSYVVKRNLLQNNVALIQSLHPDVKKVVIAGGAGHTANWLRENALRLAHEQYPQLEIEVLPPLEPQAFIDALANQPDDAAILITTYLRSPAGLAYNTPAIAKQVLDKTSLPMYAIIDPLLGTGVIGGDLFNARESAYLAMKKTLASLEAGKKRFSTVILPNRYRFDAEALAEHEIDRAQLPLNAQLISAKPVVAHAADSTSSWLSVGFILASTALFFLYRERQKLSQELRSQHSMLEARVEQRTQALKMMAVTDSLTGLINRGEFYRNLKLELRHLRNGPEGNHFAIAMLDLDNFKRINDRFGHPAGDKVLISFASRCNQLTRGPDIIGRLGGEEFAILLPHTNLQQATSILERVRSEVATMRVDLDSGDTVSVTTSIGIVVVDTPSLSTREVMMHVDQMLYTAKTQGKNRVWASCTSTLNANKPKQAELV
ncbi:GGDEF domain-containing protein [Neptunomonas marina]|uniref:diguanylate cyclase n=1 Tax=Neptunomonas marina TaxID=1815562 RepID=A0A437QAJ3_9GAMM|nr:GGDEF domain-containing protein [Neptunomonas marina]RVU31507.1 GGDEF domain-containing protein [Neptunomonas marina]